MVWHFHSYNPVEQNRECNCSHNCGYIMASTGHIDRGIVHLVILLILKTFLMIEIIEYKYQCLLVTFCLIT